MLKFTSTYNSLIVKKKTEQRISLQLRELTSETLPVSTVSVERMFFKYEVNQHLSMEPEERLSNLMKNTIESPEKITDEHLVEIVNVWGQQSTTKKNS